MDLTAEEQRVLGALMEKSLTRPDDYPLTLNALLAACNQTTNRDPVVHYDELTVERALAGLRDQELVRRGVYAGSRVPKHRHVADETLTLSRAEQAVIAVLLLRGPQTPGELKARTERAYAFAGLGELDATVDALATRLVPLVERLARQPGQKEGRVAHLMTSREPLVPSFDDRRAAITPVVSLSRVSGEPVPPEPRAVLEPSELTDQSDATADPSHRIDRLEHELATLRREVDELRAELRVVRNDD